MTHTTLHNQIIHKRLALILQLIKEGVDMTRIERETAILVLEVIDGLTKNEIRIKEGCHCFIKIEYALDQKMHGELSPEYEDMMNEAMLLDETNKTHGPDVPLLLKLATNIITRKILKNKNTNAPRTSSATLHL